MAVEAKRLHFFAHCGICVARGDDRPGWRCPISVRCADPGGDADAVHACTDTRPGVVQEQCALPGGLPGQDRHPALHLVDRAAPLPRVLRGELRVEPLPRRPRARLLAPLRDRLPRKYVFDMQRDLEEMGVIFHMNCEVGKTIPLRDLLPGVSGFTATVLAMGCIVPNPMDVPGEDLEGVEGGSLFMKRINLEPF